MVAPDDDPEELPSRLYELTVPQGASGERLDRFLASSEELSASRSAVQRWIEGGRVSVDGEPSVAKAASCARESVVSVEPLPEPVTTAEPEDIPLSILHIDDDVLVVEKPAGLVVHPAPGHPQRNPGQRDPLTMRQVRGTVGR